MAIVRRSLSVAVLRRIWSLEGQLLGALRHSLWEQERLLNRLMTPPPWLFSPMTAKEAERQQRKARRLLLQVAPQPPRPAALT